MTIRNMAKVSTLFKKGYLLTGMIMAANMFVVNEMKAMNSPYDKKDGLMATEEKEQNFGKEEKKKKKNNNNKKNFFTQDSTKDTTMNILFWENYFNSFFTLALSGFNNYFKWWDYNAGGYCNLRIGYLGWRTKKFFDIVQLDFNLNLWRGIGWSIPHIIKFRRSLTKAQIQDNTEIKQNEEGNDAKSGSNASPWVSFLFKGILRGFVSIPLTLHFSNFSISISLDSIIWEFVIGMFFNTDEKGGKKNPDDSTIKELEITSQINNGPTSSKNSGQNNNGE